jgi:hypothetical protein
MKKPIKADRQSMYEKMGFIDRGIANSTWAVKNGMR